MATALALVLLLAPPANRDAAPASPPVIAVEPPAPGDDAPRDLPGQLHRADGAAMTSLDDDVTMSLVQLLIPDELPVS